MISRMRIISSPRTIDCAHNIMVVTIATYSSPNKSVPELHELLKNRTEIVSLKGVCRGRTRGTAKHPARPR